MVRIYSCIFLSLSLPISEFSKKIYCSINIDEKYLSESWYWEKDFSTAVSGWWAEIDLVIIIV